MIISLEISQPEHDGLRHLAAREFGDASPETLALLIRRIAHMFAHRLQIQEQLVHQIADAVQELTGSPHVAVTGSGEHLCMSMRGIKTPAIMRSSAMRGLFLQNPAARTEFLSMCK